MERAAEPERQAADGFFVRRIDGEETALWAQAQALYAAQGADGVWALRAPPADGDSGMREAQAETMCAAANRPDSAGAEAPGAASVPLAAAELWGLFRADQGAVQFAALCGGGDALSPAAALRKTGFAPQGAQLVLPPAGAAPCAGAPLLLRTLQQRARQRAEIEVGAKAPADVPDTFCLAVLPVKTGAPLLPAYFAAGFALRAMRPLAWLRPHYLFLPAAVCGSSQTLPGRSIMVAVENSLLLSRLLAEGWMGVGMRGEKIALVRGEAL